MNYLVIIAVVLLVCLKRSCAKLPSTIKTCSRNDPDLNNCIIRAVNDIRPKLADGNLGDGYQVLPLEPLSLDAIEMGRGREFKAVFSDMQVTGGSNFVIEKLVSNVTSNKIGFDVQLLLPKIDFVGKYALNIKILLIDIAGKGDMVGTFENCKASVRMRGAPFKKDGVDSVKFSKMTIRIHVNSMKLELKNLFNGDKVLGEVGNNLINDNQDLYLSEITPGLEKGLSRKFLDIANQILATTSLDEMFPPQ